MNIQDAIKESKKTGKPIKREGWDEWVKIKGDCFYLEDLDDIEASLGINDITATDWEVKGEWYNVENFKKKYPNGVLCMLTNCDSFDDQYLNNYSKYAFVDVIVDYDKDTKEFINIHYERIRYAKPIPEDKLPFILKEV